MSNFTNLFPSYESNGAYMAALVKTRMQVDDRMVSLSPGMAVTVEIKTGSRHVIEYLLSPLLRHKQQAMREQ
jgi:hemolysin D